MILQNVGKMWGKCGEMFYICLQIAFSTHIMARFYFLVKSPKGENSLSIYVRLRDGRNGDFTRKTNLVVSSDDWNISKQQPKGTTPQGKNLKVILSKLESKLLENLNESKAEGKPITGDWLERNVNKAQNRAETKEEQERTFLMSYMDYYIEYIKSDHIQKNGKRGLSKNTVKKFVTLRNRLSDFLGRKSSGVRISDVNPQFMRKFDRFLRERAYNDNTIGSLVTKLKTVCRFAKVEGLRIAENLNQVTATHGKAYMTILSFEELNQIAETPMPSDRLDNAKDWLLIGCYIGQRVGDLLRLTDANIINHSDVRYIGLEQHKTNKRVVVPLLPEVERILQKRGGKFPHSISDVKFNKYIKEVCKLSGISEPIEGAKIVVDATTKEKRKIVGTYPKHELVTSHICRRSFASNYYGKMATPLIMQATGHAKESTFLIYIGKSSTDFLEEMAEQFAKVSAENVRARSNGEHLRIVKGEARNVQ